MRQMLNRDDEDAVVINMVQEKLDSIIGDAKAYVRCFVFEKPDCFPLTVEAGYLKADVDRIIPKLKRIMPDLREVRGTAHERSFWWRIEGLVADSRESIDEAAKRNA
jgi:hypothetical protein